MVAVTAPWRIGVDVGGTFTDLALIDAAGRSLVLKTPSVPADPARGVLDAVEKAAARLGIAVEALLAGCRLFVHGSTVATNTVLEGKGAKVGLLVTHGFRDSLEIRRGLRENPWDHRTPFPPVMVPRYLRRPVRGRLDPDGREIAPLDAEDVRAACALFREEGVEAVAISLFNAYADPRHERAAAAIVRESWGGDWVSLSSEIAPTIGEYARTSTTVTNAAVAPRVVTYLRGLAEALRARGLPGALLVSQSNGGVVSVDQVAARPVNLVLSGPAAGVGALGLAAQALGDSDLISMEIGGTSCDVALMSAGRVATSDDLEIAGYHLSVPSVEIHTVGAGGGTIAGVDAAGMLYAGPKGAGARPGPACYGFGGVEPTVTDAQLVLGRLAPGAYAGGSVALDPARARAAIRTRLAEPLGLSVEEAAAGVIRLVEQHLLHAVERISVQRGFDPRRFTLVPAGGAGPLHGPSVAARLGAKRVYVPREAGAFCALGLLQSDVRQDFTQVFMRPLAADALPDAAAGFAALEARAREALAAEGFSGGDVALTRALDLRYAGQQWDVRVDLPEGGALDEGTIRALFEAEYDRQFGHIQPGGAIRITALRVAGFGLIDAAAPTAAARGEGIPAPVGARPVWFEEGWREAAIYDGATLAPGHAIEGPAIVAEGTMTAIARPGDRLEVDAAGNFVITLAEATAAAPAVEGGGVDPITLALVQNRLDHVAQQMGRVMVRTARSPIFSQAHDFSCFLAAADGAVVSQADGIPIHTGGGGFAARAILAARGDAIAEGDVYLLNDPYAAGGNHLPDWVIARPVFAGGRLLAFACNRAHQSDIGGGAAGTYNPQATEIFHEGLRLPVMTLVEAGRVREDLWALLKLNCRTPDLLDGDLRAMLGSTRIGAERIAALAAELGPDRARAAFAGILDYAQTRFRAAVARLPDGVYRGEDRSDTDCFGEADIRTRVTLTVSGGELVVDFTGTDPQIAGFKNSSLANTHSAVYTALYAFFEADLPRNEGSFRSVRIVAPEGTHVNARAPAPMTMCTVFPAHDIIHAVWKALAQADPSRACAGWARNIFGVTSGTAEGAREPFVMYHNNLAAGGGAIPGRDGFEQIGHLCTLGGLSIPDLEVYERIYPVRFLRQEFRCDSGGAGAFRGGTGVDYAVEVRVPARYSFRGEGLRTPSGYGVAGGGYGAAGAMTLYPEDGGEPIAAPQYGLMDLPALRYEAYSPGGGGLGDPRSRDPARVLRDVRDGKVSREAARVVYAVALTADGRAVDEEGTRALRDPPPSL
jgi:N-methylhydantoinase A/oxoprolinase/acetone carboxylase beta subunit/N-methylhydantoinase B/oxoprolinase/acetone carboxylase alpha subunit